MIRFSDKVVIVTGAASGIGAACAKRFSDEGANVVLADCDADGARVVAASLPPASTLVQITDVSDDEQVVAMVNAAVSRFGRLDVLVSNAGIFAQGQPEEISIADWRKVIAVDLDGAFFCARAAIPHLIRSKGSIVFTASVSGLGGDWCLSPYNAAKGGVVNLTRALALDLGGRGIRVNSVCPSLTRTGMTEDTFRDPDQLKAFEQRIPLGRGCEPREVAAAIAFLASDDASFITGANLPVDGGVSASNGQPAQ